MRRKHWSYDVDIVPLYLIVSYQIKTIVSQKELGPSLKNGITLLLTETVESGVTTNI